MLHACVCDTGVGIPPEVQRKIFQPFVQGDMSTTRLHGGTGLGLSISRQLVALMGGHLWLESEVGKGSVFHFCVPLRASPHAPPQQQEAAAVEAIVPLGSLCVLVAEDIAINQLVATRMLEKDGHTVVLATNGREALEKWRAGGVDLILMDVQMPEMDGLEAAAQIRRQEAGTPSHVPIVALTAHAMKEDRAKCLAAGMDEYLSKPFRLDDVRRMMARLVRATSPRKPAVAAERPVFDRAFQAERFKDDPELLQKLLIRFANELPGRVDPMRVAQEKGDLPALATLAHAMKGVSATLGASALSSDSVELEAAVKKGDRQAVQAVVQRLLANAERTAQVVLGLTPPDTPR